MVFLNFTLPPGTHHLSRFSFFSCSASALLIDSSFSSFFRYLFTVRLSTFPFCALSLHALILESFSRCLHVHVNIFPSPSPLSVIFFLHFGHLALMIFATFRLCPHSLSLQT